MNETNLMIVVILILCLIPAVKCSITHLKGEGACCGGPKEKPSKKKIKGQIIARYRFSIGGMHCVNCKNRIERRVNELAGVVIKVNLERKNGVVSLYNDTSVEKIKEIIENLDFTVTDITKVK